MKMRDPNLVLNGQDPDIGMEVRNKGLLKRINDEILKPSGFVLRFRYGGRQDPAKTGPFEVNIERYKP